MLKANEKSWEQGMVVENRGWQFHDPNLYAENDFVSLTGHYTFAKLMELIKDYATPDYEQNRMKFEEKIYDLQGKSVVDIAGGPVSLLLRCKNYSRAFVVDPGDFPDYISDRYKANNIEWVKLPAEQFEYPTYVDEVWFYNALQHVYDPFVILDKAKKNSDIIRLCEGLGTAVSINHPQTLTEPELEAILGVGQITYPEDPSPSPRGRFFHGVFHTNYKIQNVRLVVQS